MTVYSHPEADAFRDTIREPVNLLCGEREQPHVSWVEMLCIEINPLRWARVKRAGEVLFPINPNIVLDC